MSLEIHAPEADALARELAAATGEDIDTEVIRAIEERLARTPRRRAADDAAAIEALFDRLARLPVLDPRSPEQIIGASAPAASRPACCATSRPPTAAVRRAAGRGLSPARQFATQAAHRARRGRPDPLLPFERRRDYHSRSGNQRGRRRHAVLGEGVWTKSQVPLSPRCAITGPRRSGRGATVAIPFEIGRKDDQP
jgi:antitoxin VapB